MVYDCFLFHNELELLELRLMELNDKVDMFVLCESERTFRGKPKPLHFAENQIRFVKWIDKIRYVHCNGFHNKSAWENEWQQRDFLGNGVMDARDDDVIILSDVDEIPNPAVIPDKRPEKPFVCKQRLYYYFVNCFQPQAWPGTLIGGKDLLPFAASRRALFEGPGRFTGGIVPDGGWHFSFLGGYDRICEKIEAYSESTTDTPEVKDKDHVRHCLETGADIFYRKGPAFDKQFVPINDTFPKHIHEWLKKYPHMAKPVVQA